jgi:hypothetical protein
MRREKKIAPMAVLAEFFGNVITYQFATASDLSQLDHKALFK